MTETLPMPVVSGMSFEDFLRAYDGAHAEWIDGSVIPMSPVSEGPADLVVEVTSPESRGRDRGENFYEYEQGRVPEYWLIDPPRKTVELFRLDPRGRYAAVAASAGGRMESAVLEGFWLDPVWLWSDPIPKLDSVLKQWGLR